MAKVTLQFTPKQLESLISIIETIESLHGCGDSEFGEVNFDTETSKDVKNLDRMFAMNGFKREK